MPPFQAVEDDHEIHVANCIKCQRTRSDALELSSRQLLRAFMMVLAAACASALVDVAILFAFLGSRR
jgi:hypothetical protein